jgi:hypothetical protein
LFFSLTGKLPSAAAANFLGEPSLLEAEVDPGNAVVELRLEPATNVSSTEMNSAAATSVSSAAASVAARVSLVLASISVEFACIIAPNRVVSAASWVIKLSQVVSTSARMVVSVAVSPATVRRESSSPLIKY